MRMWHELCSRMVKLVRMYAVGGGANDGGCAFFRFFFFEAIHFLQILLLGGRGVAVVRGRRGAQAGQLDARQGRA